MTLDRGALFANKAEAQKTDAEYRKQNFISVVSPIRRITNCSTRQHFNVEPTERLKALCGGSESDVTMREQRNAATGEYVCSFEEWCANRT